MIAGYADLSFVVVTYRKSLILMRSFCLYFLIWLSNVVNQCYISGTVEQFACQTAASIDSN